MGEMMSVKELIKAGCTQELKERGDDALIQKGLIKTKVFGWITEDEYNFAQTNLDAVHFGKTVDELEGIPSIEDTITESTERRDVVQRKTTRVLAFVFRLQEMIREREDREYQEEQIKKAKFKGIMQNEPPVTKQDDKIHPCPICGSDKFKPGNDYKTVKWAYCDNCGALYDQISGKTQKEYSNANK